jgi:hypothetical protein
MDYANIKAKVDNYNSILENTKNYRKAWDNGLSKMITDNLAAIIKDTKLAAFIDLKDDIENLEAVTLSLGTEVSGIAERIPGSKSKRPFIKSKGSLIFQQLFNGKLMMMIMYPHIEGYGQPKPPKTLEILRPEEVKEAFIVRYVEEFIKEIIEWEDFDDDVPEKMGMTPIGFGVHKDLISDELIEG